MTERIIFLFDFSDHHRDLALALEPQPAPSDGSSMLDISVDPAISHLKGKDKSQTLPLKDLTNLSVQSLQSMAKSNGKFFKIL